MPGVHAGVGLPQVLQAEGEDLGDEGPRQAPLKEGAHLQKALPLPREEDAVEGLVLGVKPVVPLESLIG